jgi:outer membrane murein-binding lipoprotein Lpp
VIPHHCESSVRSPPAGSLFAVFAAVLVLAGCSDPAQGLIRKVAARVTNAPWHELHGWKAADFFTDPQVIALCDAIAANDVARMKERIAAGADVNARGKGNMTPLLWAFVDNKPERFRLLLEAGANPNVYIESDFGIRQAFSPGDSVTHMACRSTFDHFWPVFEHGGDPNWPNKEPGCRGESPVYTVIKSGAGDKKKRIARLAEAGGSMNRAPGASSSPLGTAASWFGRFDLCLVLLDLGADPSQYEGNEITKITHYLEGTLEAKSRGQGQLRDASPEQLADFDRLVERLEAMGETLAAAYQEAASSGCPVASSTDSHRSPSGATWFRWLTARAIGMWTNRPCQRPTTISVRPASAA